VHEHSLQLREEMKRWASHLLSRPRSLQYVFMPMIRMMFHLFSPHVPIRVNATPCSRGCGAGRGGGGVGRLGRRTLASVEPQRPPSIGRRRRRSRSGHVHHPQ
jgi:hypothetical protein